MTFMVCSCHDEDGNVLFWPLLVENETLNGSIFIIHIVLLHFFGKFHPTQITLIYESEFEVYKFKILKILGSKFI